MSKKCINCGSELDDDQLFCDDCGTKQIIEHQSKAKKDFQPLSQKTIVTEADKQPIIQTVTDNKIRLEAEKAEKARKQEERKNNPKHLAIVSLLLGIVSYLSILTIIIPIATSITGLIVGFKGFKSDLKKTAIMGIITNLSFLILFIAILIFA